MRPDLIHLPMTKNGRPFDFPIVDLHLELHEQMCRLSREWMFPGSEVGDRPSRDAAGRPNFA